MNKINKITLSVFLIIVFFFSTLYLKDFRIDASSDTLVAQNDPDFEYFNFYKNIFPSKNNLIIAIKSNEIIDLSLLNEIKTISDRISEIDQVHSVFNINKAPILFLNNSSLISLSNSDYDTIIDSKFNINEVLNEFANSPIYSNQIINNNKNITSLIIFLKKNKKLEDLKINKEKYILDKSYYQKKSEIDKERNDLIFEIRTIIKDSSDNYDYYLGGIEMISSDVISFVKSDIIIFSISVLSLVILILIVIFRKIKWVFSILISSIFAVYTMVGVTGFLNFEITAVSANFLSLMFILSISMHIHIVNYYLDNENELVKTFKVMFWPCFYTFLTTIVAFLSLVISDIKPVVDFGIVMIISLIVVIINAFTTLPLIVSLFNREKNTRKFEFNLIRIFKTYSLKFKKSLLVINFILFIISAYGISSLSVENSFIKYFKKNTEIFKGMKLIDTQLGGTTPLDVILKFENEELSSNVVLEDELEEEFEIDDDIFNNDLFQDENNIWFTENKLQTIKKIHKYLENRNEIGKVSSIYSLIDVANKINKSELSTFELSILYNEIPEQYKEDLVDPFLNVNENMVKITARVKDSENIIRSKLINDINKFTAESFENVEEIKINGLLVLYNNMLSSLFSSQIKSLGFVLLAIFIMFILLFRSFKLSVVGIIPNILASTFILGIIGLLNIPLDIMTITIAAISIGIAVDNTIHYLYRYKINFTNSNDFFDSIEKTHLSVGKAVFTTSIAISLGFLTLCFSNFVPTIIFGLFTSLAMIFAMIGVLITLPSILNYLR